MNIKKLIKEELKIFIMEKDLLQLVLAVYLGEVLKDFFEAFVDDLVIPLSEEFLPNKKGKIKDFKIKIRGVEFKVGDFVKQSIMLLIAFLLSYFFTKFLFKLLK